MLNYLRDGRFDEKFDPIIKDLMEQESVVLMQITNLSDYVALRWAPEPEGTRFPQGRWLTMTPVSGACMFCLTPEGDCLHHRFNPGDCDDLTGYLTCSKGGCVERAASLIKDAKCCPRSLFIQQLADAGAHVKVQRTSGVIEDDWVLGNPLFKVVPDLTLCVSVLNERANVIKAVPVSKFLELNDL